MGLDGSKWKRKLRASVRLTKMWFGCCWFTGVEGVSQWSGQWTNGQNQEFTFDQTQSVIPGKSPRPEGKELTVSVRIHPQVDDTKARKKVQTKIRIQTKAESEVILEVGHHFIALQRFYRYTKIPWRGSKVRS